MVLVHTNIVKIKVKMRFSINVLYYKFESQQINWGVQQQAIQGLHLNQAYYLIFEKRFFS